MDATSRPARSRPVQKTSPLARTTRTRAEGGVDSERSTLSIASSFAAVTRFPSPGLSSVKVKTSPARSMLRPAGVSALGELLSDDMPPPDRHNTIVHSGAKGLELIAIIVLEQNPHP